MPISISASKKDNLCRGGRSFGCKKISESADPESRILGPHEAREPRTCRRCHAYMGCFICAHPPVELICLRCHDWACDEGEKEHGKIVVNRAAASVGISRVADRLANDEAKRILPVTHVEMSAEREFCGLEPRE